MAAAPVAPKPLPGKSLVEKTAHAKKTTEQPVIQAA
jgi:hypothetical protein